jgi:DNA-binding response OmpR family regulator
MAMGLPTVATTAAYDGIDAIESARDFRPEVVLLDIGLPVLDGYEVARRLRRLDETKNAFLIAMTGYGRTEDRIRALSAGFNYHITKPADLNELDAVIKTIAPDCIDGFEESGSIPAGARPSSPGARIMLSPRSGSGIRSNFGKESEAK